MAATKTAKPTHPTYLDMAKAAIGTLADKKGSSVPAIKTYIQETYSLDPDAVKKHLKPALAKGLEDGILKRPKNSEATGCTGRFKIDKEKSNDEAKAKAKKEKEKLAKEKLKEKAAAKTVAVKKSPKKKVKAKVDTKKKVVKKTPIKKIAATKSTLKTPKRTPKKLKMSKTSSAKATPKAKTKSKK